MSEISPFAILKILIGAGGEPKSAKRLRSGELLVDTMSASQTKSFLLEKSFLNSPLLQPLPSIPKPDISKSTPVISTSSSTQAHLLPSTSTAATVSEPEPTIPTPNDALYTTRIESSSSVIYSLSNSRIPPPSGSTTT
ncbi:hypothetical protein TNCV_3507261 [Trichonephila clavipes]|uniref:Uncharacterized protein n=1 Tax=Trichonephila clavipes TaxID=2585209 RepID=A0A8X6RY51_TRICX|nr:hypothetical protein TNCV_3507261 [Trichonephila clavipes]